MHFREEGVVTVDQEGIRVEFYMAQRQHPRRSEEEGRPIFESIPYVKIEQPGDNKSFFEGKATPEHHKRWPELWKAFEEGQKGVFLEDGDMPIESWAPLDRARALELKFVGVKTLKQLAAVADGELERLGMGARKEREAAQRALMSPSDAEKALTKRLADQELRIAELTSRLEQMLNMPAVAPLAEQSMKAASREPTKRKIA